MSPAEVQAPRALALAREERLERGPGARGQRGELEAERFAEARDRSTRASPADPASSRAIVTRLVPLRVASASWVSARPWRAERS